MRADGVETLDKAAAELCRPCQCIGMYAIVADGDFLILTIIGPDGKELHQYCSQPAECFADGKVSLEDVRRDWPYTREIDAAFSSDFQRARARPTFTARLRSISPPNNFSNSER